MDTADFSQIIISEETMGDSKNYLLENGIVTVALHEGIPLFVDIADLRGARDHLYRARSARRPVHRR